MIMVETWSSQESREFKVTPRYLKLSVGSRFPLMVKVKFEKEAVLIGFPNNISFDLDIFSVSLFLFNQRTIFWRSAFILNCISRGVLSVQVIAI